MGDAVKTERRPSFLQKLPFKFGHQDTLNTTDFPKLGFGELKVIFQYLDLDTLLSLNTTSKQFYLASIACLYKRVTVIGNENYAHDHYNKCTSSTIINVKQFLRLVLTLYHNQHLARLIQSLSVVDLCQEEGFVWSKTIPEILGEQFLQPVGVPFDLKTMTFYDVFALGLSLMSNLEFINCDGLRLDSWLTLLKGTTVKRMVIQCKGNSNLDNNVDHSLNTFKSVEDLKINVFDSGSVNGELMFVANLLKEAQVVPKLKRLTLEYIKTNEFSFDNKLPNFNWLTFLYELESNNCFFSNLTHLGVIKCHIDTIQQQVVTLLGKLVDFSKLESLDLEFKEYSHKFKGHSIDSSEDNKQTNNCFLLRIPAMPSLKYLTLKPTKNCIICQRQSLLTFLGKRLSQNQITHLSLTFTSITFDDVEEINRYLAEKQQSIECLSYNDLTLQHNFIKYMDNWFEENDTPCTSSVQLIEQNNYHYKNYSVFAHRIDSFDQAMVYSSNRFVNDWKSRNPMLRIFLKQFLLNTKSGNHYMDELLKKLHHLRELFIFGFRFHLRDGVLLLYEDNHSADTLMYLYL
ncbi:BA75_04590T0 [Komagataella pastoris]|uniref:BA75_04590T0 n=1 Tax=Komagataella pastoris TaxID=4922 RepID=A0A1B2JJF9_PICPA|nr:BA75_04590T0 [Komagataella pastoris]